MCGYHVRFKDKLGSATKLRHLKKIHSRFYTLLAKWIQQMKEIMYEWIKCHLKFKLNFNGL
jgi:hypothetical protein